tara:strand:- start:4755 stop:5210 length:456 start_codon:yes stop_codon:yes gene_type:complete
MGAYTIEGETYGLTYTVTNSTTTPDDGSVVADIQLWGGTQVTETAWLDGGAAAGSYPGSLDGFKAKNSNTTNATAGLRLVTLQFDLKHASATTLDVASHATAGASFSKILAVVGQSHQAGTHVYTVLTDADTVTITPQATADKYQITLLIA